MLQIFFEGLTSLNCSQQMDFALLQNQLQLANYPVHEGLLSRANQTEIMITTIIITNNNNSNNNKNPTIIEIN